MTNYLAAFVDEFHQMEITDVVISSGFCSAPLSILFCEHEFHCYLNIDERSAAFFALE